jgi:hypothetical protein
LTGKYAITVNRRSSNLNPRVVPGLWKVFFHPNVSSTPAHRTATSLPSPARAGGGVPP